MRIMLEIIRCPSCQTERLRPTMASGNTFGSSAYSDGRFDAPMYMRSPYIVKCPACKVFYKIEKQSKDENAVVRGYANIQDKRPHVRFLTVKQSMQAIGEGLFNGSEEGSGEWVEDMLRLRVELWWAFNKKPRKDRENDAYNDNCHALLQLLADRAGDVDLLRRAELSRNIGLFDECRQLLGQIEDAEKYEKYIAAIKKAAEQGNLYTVRVK